MWIWSRLSHSSTPDLLLMALLISGFRYSLCRLLLLDRQCDPAHFGASSAAFRAPRCWPNSLRDVAGSGTARFAIGLELRNRLAGELGFRDFSSLFPVKENRRKLGNFACCISTD